jgi:hypothetical protein
MKTRYEKVLVKDKLPDDARDVFVKLMDGVIEVGCYEGSGWYVGTNPRAKVIWWLEELPEPTDEDIEIWAKSVQPQHGGYLTDYIYSAKAMRDGKIHIQNK